MQEGYRDKKYSFNFEYTNLQNVMNKISEETSLEYHFLFNMFIFSTKERLEVLALKEAANQENKKPAHIMIKKMEFDPFEMPVVQILSVLARKTGLDIKIQTGANIHKAGKCAPRFCCVRTEDIIRFLVRSFGDDFVSNGKSIIIEREENMEKLKGELF